MFFFLKVEGKDLFESSDHPGPWQLADVREVVRQLLEAWVAYKVFVQTNMEIKEKNKHRA